MMDFELATINSFSAVWPRIKTKGCLFHYFQALWKHFSTYSTIYKADSEETKWFKKWLALPLVPLDKIESVVDEII
jgi:hypothetical protein